MKSVLEGAKWCQKMNKKHFYKLLTMTERDGRDFEKAKKNVICGKQYTKKDILVRDHCHNHLVQRIITTKT